MDQKKLVESSPLRALDAATQGAPRGGELGILVARHGAGKTPFVVSIALDALLQGRRVLHVALDARVEHVRGYYDEIFAQLAKEAQLDDPASVHLSFERGRRIHSYMAGAFSVEKLSQALGFMNEHAEFTPDLLLVDGFEGGPGVEDPVPGLLELASAQGAALWMTAVSHRDVPITDPDGIPEPVSAYKDRAAAILGLRTRGHEVEISLFKPRPETGDGVLPLVLDATRMLLRRTQG